VSHPRPAATRALARHFRRLDEGDYEAAFALMGSRYRSANSNWTSAREEAEPSINVIKVGSPSYNGHGDADVRVKFYAQDAYDSPGSDTHCRRFSGTAHMILEGGKWRYDPYGNDLSSSVADGSSECP
jgi:hypothetical protein